jgi:hypothetical protein
MSSTLPQLLLRKVERWMSHVLVCRDTSGLRITLHRPDALSGLCLNCYLHCTPQYTAEDKPAASACTTVHNRPHMARRVFSGVFTTELRAGVA